MVGEEKSATALERYEGCINEFTERLLRGYLDALDGPNGSRQPKEFNDPVWGTIALEPHEVVILDSPLLQRLRRVRQLGVVHFVYPGANHSRFEHSLGVCHQVGQLASSINAHHNDVVLPPEWQDTLRLAGLCHDVGHGLMSHVVENALVDDDETSTVLLEFKKSVNRSSPPQLSEMAAYYMMRSPAVRELFTKAYERSPLKKFPDTQLDNISRMIVGLKVDDQFPLIHELISGPFDADKLDYMPRDATMCGVPVVTDVVRLIQKVRSLPVSSDKLPEDIHGVKSLPTGHVITGVARSGASALDEVSLSRSLMFDKIYRHHKVRSAEAMIASVIESVGPLLAEWAPMLPLRLNDEAFLDLDRTVLAERNRAAGEPVTDADLDSAAEILDRLRHRQLFARAFAFAQTMPFDAYRNDSSARQANEAFIRELSDQPEHRDAFIKEVVAQVQVIAQKLDRTAHITELPGELRKYIRVDPPTSSGRGSESDQSRAFLIEDKRVFKFEKVRAESRGLTDAYINTKDVGFVFAPRGIMDMVHVAAEVSARKLYKVRVPQEMRAYAKLGGDEMHEIRRRLEAAGYYDDLPRDLRPEPEYLDLAETHSDIRTVMAQLQGYMGPSQQDTSSLLKEQRIRDWLVQFPDHLAPLALKVAGGVKMLSREDANSALTGFVNTHSQFKDAHVVPLGEPKDGSSVHTYHLGDSASELGLTLSSMSDALLTSDPIILVDDLIGRGSSAISIFESLLAAAPTQNLDEQRAGALREDAQHALRARPVAVVASVGFTEGVSTLRERMRELGFKNAIVDVMLDAGTLPTVDSVLDGAGVTPGLKDEFLEECRRIGDAVLNDGEERHDAEWRAGKALGYGNHKTLVVSSYNTPTICLTALWAKGMVDGIEWRPLLPRRKKK